MIYVTRAQATKEFPRYHGRTLWLACARIAKAEVKSLNDWLIGNIWGYRITDPDGAEQDSGWGFLGDSEYCLAEGESSLMHYVNRAREFDYRATHANQRLLFNPTEVAAI